MTRYRISTWGVRRGGWHWVVDVWRGEALIDGSTLLDSWGEACEWLRRKAARHA